MNDREPRMIGRVAQNHERRGPRLALTFFLGMLMGVGGFAMLGLTHQPVPVKVAAKPDASLCQARLDTWLYGKDWITKQPAQQWESLKAQLGECVR